MIDDRNYTSVLGVTSPFGLLEELFSEDPWRVLICTIFLNKTQRKQGIDAIIFRLLKRWPTAESVVKDADDDEEAVREYIFSLVRPTGLGRTKANAFVLLSRDYLSLLTTKNQRVDQFPNGDMPIGNTIDSARCKEMEFNLTRSEVKQIFSCGDYAADAYQIFVRKDFQSPVVSNDYILVAYVEWKRSLYCIL